MSSDAVRATFLAAPVAHRGLHDRAAGVIENSLPAVRAAAEAGYGIEIDVQPSADGVAMVFHDATLDRLTAARGPVHARTAAELSAIPLSGGGGATIPTLAEVLAAAGRAAMVVEIKSQAPAPTDALCAAVAAALPAAPGPVCVMSFEPAAVDWFRRNAPEVPRGLVSCAHDDPEDAAGLTEEARAALASLAAFDDVAADFVSYGAKDLPRPEVAALRARGVPVLCWTIRSEAEAAAAAPHVDQITFEGFRP